MLDGFNNVSSDCSAVTNTEGQLFPADGCTIEELSKLDDIRILVDSSFVRTGYAEEFFNIWRGLTVGAGEEKYIFMPLYEIQNPSIAGVKLPIKNPLWGIRGDSAEECFLDMKDKGRIWNVVWLTGDEYTGIAEQNAAKAAGMLLRRYRLLSDGRLQALDRQQSKEDESTQYVQDIKRVFESKDEPVTIQRLTVTPAPAPECGHSVCATGEGVVYTLDKPIMTDHTSITYRTNNPDYYAKIYTQNARTMDIFEKKARLMLRERIDIKGVCWPVDVLSDCDGEFVGILVPASRGIQLTRSVFGGEAKIRQNLSGWNKIDLCTLAYTITDTICKLHKCGIRFGCFNPAAVYLTSPEDVYFVDCDCWQVEDYPVMSKNITFTPPELLEEGNRPRLYSADEENYQVALLCFMLMLPGKYPYAKKKSENEFDGLRDRSFPFGIGNDKRRSQDSERPSSAWQIVWDHLPYNMCECFYNSFHPDGKNAAPGTRIKDGKWLGLISEYKKHLMKDENAMSRALFPYTFRKDAKRSFVRCEVCGKEHPDFYFLRKIRIGKEEINIWDKGYRVCLPCAVDESKKSFVCRSCGREFFYNNRTRIVHEIGKLDFDWNEQKWCSDCKKRTVKCINCGEEVTINQLREFEDKKFNIKRSVCQKCFTKLIEDAKRQREELRNRTHSRVQCRECGRWFEITVGEAEWYVKNGKHLPKRCKDCRAKR